MIARRVFVNVVILCSICAQFVHGHSWIACTDYTEKNGRFFEHSKCRGYPRGANQLITKKVPFGKEKGYDHQPTEEIPCRFQQNDRVYYDREYPMAVYYPGQQVVLAHPMKEHGADSRCTNLFIPDTGSWIYRSRANQQVDPTLSDFQQRLVFDLGATPLAESNAASRTYPKFGYQNAPAFCLDLDKSLGTYSFNVPLNLAPGRYTFMWMWAFNNMDDLFSTCFEVRIARNQLERNMMLKKNGFFDLSEPCGGLTSNPVVKGVCNRLIRASDYGYGGHGRSRGEAIRAELHLTLLTLLFIHWLIR